MSDQRKREGQQLLIRFPAGSDLRDRLDKAAKESGRTTTAEVIHRLKESLEAEETAGVPDFTEDARLEDVKKRLDRLEAAVFSGDPAIEHEQETTHVTASAQLLKRR